jgi:hypothetical protein
MILLICGFGNGLPGLSAARADESVKPVTLGLRVSACE